MVTGDDAGKRTPALRPCAAERWREPASHLRRRRTVVVAANLGVSTDGRSRSSRRVVQDLGHVADLVGDVILPLSRVARINQLLTRWRRNLAGTGTTNAMLLIDIFAENPFITIKGVAKRLDVAFTTAQRAIDSLRAAKIVTETSETKRDRVFCAQQVLLILEEPARLAPG